MEEPELASDEPPAEGVIVEYVQRGRRHGPKRAAVYGRYSTPRQKSIEAQFDIAREHVQRNGWRMAYKLSDKAMKGKDPTRPGFQRLLDIAATGRIDIIVVWKLDRLARTLRDLANLHDELEEYGVQIYSCTEPITGNAPLAKFLFGSLANVAQLETDMIRDRVQMGMYHAAIEGRWVHPVVPFGYRRTRGKKLTIDAPSADIVRLVFDAVRRFKSGAVAAHELNEQGIEARHGNWTASKLWHLVSKPIYKGLFCVGSVEKEMPELAIVSPTDWNECVRIRKDASGRGKPAPDQLRQKAIDKVFDEYLKSLEAVPE